MIGAGDFSHQGWNQSTQSAGRRRNLPRPSPDWQALACWHAWAADAMVVRLVEQMLSLGYPEQDCRDLTRNLHGVWPAWFHHDDWRWKPSGVEVSTKVCSERTVLVLRPGANFGGETARAADCRAAEREFRMHQPLMKAYSTWLRFDPSGRCVALCKYATDPRG